MSVSNPGFAPEFSAHVPDPEPSLEALAPPGVDFLPARLLQDGASVTRQILEDRDVDALVPRLLAVSACSGALFGLAIGLPGGGAQAMISAFKLPVVLLGAASLGLPALQLGASLSGRRLRSAQVSALLLQSLATAATTMAALVPLAVVVWLTANTFYDSEWFVYRRAVAAFSAVAALGGLVGASRLLRALPFSAVLCWGALFGVAGLQMTWLLRPVIGSPSDDLVLLRSLQSNGFAEILRLIDTVL